MFSTDEQEEMIQLYKSGLSLNEVANKFKVTGASVYHILRKNNIQRRSLSEANTLLWTKERKEKQSAIKKGKPTWSLGKKWTLNHVKKSPNMRGGNNPNWKGGKTKLAQQIRMSAEYSFWRKQVFDRDNYSCVECGRKRKKGDRVIIEADHIYPFSKILDDFDVKNIDDAISCQMLWSVDNGRTLCKECHIKTDTYGVNLIKNA